jgi:hypothetical protein
MENKKQTAMKGTANGGEETASVYIPSDGIGPFLEGAHNGVNFRIPTGRIVEVPERIAEILIESRRGLREDGDAAPFEAAGGRRIG